MEFKLNFFLLLFFRSSSFFFISVWSLLMVLSVHFEGAKYAHTKKILFQREFYENEPKSKKKILKDRIMLKEAYWNFVADLNM